MSDSSLEPSKVCEVFNASRIKAEKIFSNLRTLPPIGGCWKPSFDKAFAIYSKVTINTNSIHPLSHRFFPPQL